jgi:superfamily II DNA or RNA helicase
MEQEKTGTEPSVPLTDSAFGAESLTLVPAPLPKYVISQHGYGILKTSLTTKDIRLIKKELTVKPFIPPGAPVKPDPFSVFMESPQRLWVPREWGIQKFGEPDVYRMSTGYDCSKNLTFKGEMRELQLNILKDWPEIIKSKKPEGRILTVPCGYGKTVMSLWCASKVGKKTLIIVHKEFLMNQFKDEIKRFLPDARVGIIQGPVCDVDNKEIVIGMLQSLVSKTYPKEMFSEFGMVIFDECHHLAAEVFSQVLMFLGSWRMLGLSATPERKDRLSKVFHWYLGDFLAKIENRGKESVEIVKVYHRPLFDGCGSLSIEEYMREPVNHMDKVVLPTLISIIAENTDRTRMIMNIAITLIKTEGRKVLILSDRKSQLAWIHDKIRMGSYGLENEIGFYIGGMKEKDLNISAKKSLVLGTFAMASEGMNVPELDTLILASPKSDIVQSVGRILRKKKEERIRIPKVIDIIDPHQSLLRQSKNRHKFYKFCSYEIKEYNWIGNKFVEREANSLKKVKTSHPPKADGVEATKLPKIGGDLLQQECLSDEDDEDEEEENIVCMIE